MPFGNLGTIWSEIGLDIRKLDAGLMAANLKLATADRTITSFGQRLTNASTKLIMAGGLMVGAVAGVGIAAIKMATDYEKSMRNVNSISNLSEQQFAKISNEVLQLSTRMPQSAKTLADGLYEIASSGFAGADGMKVLEASAKAASAGMTDTATSAKGVVSVLNAYALSADDAGKVSDTMFRTVDKGIITFEELSNVVGDFVGMGKIAELEFNELSGALAYMTTKGIDASSAGVSLNRVILAIIDPSKEMAEALRNAGYESGETALHQLGLVGVMDLLSKSTSGSLTEIQGLFPEMRALRGASALLSSGIDDLNGYMTDFKDTTGATNIALAEQSKALDYQLKILRNNISVIAITLGNKYIPQITSTTTKLSEFISAHQEATISMVDFGLKAVGTVGSVMLLAGALGKLRLYFLNLGPAGAGGVATASMWVLADGVNILADKIDNPLIANLVRLLYPLSAAKKGLQDNISVIDALRKGYISWQDAAHINIFTIDEYKKKIDEAVVKEEELKNGIYKSIEAFRSAQIFVKNFSDELPNASNEMANLLLKLQDGEISIEAFTLGVIELRKETKNGRVDIEESIPVYDDFADKQEIARRKVDAHAQAQKEAKKPIEETTGAIDDQVKTVDELRASYNQLIGTLFDGINATNELQEAEWAQIAAQKEVNRLIEEGKEGTEEYEQAINELDSANQSVIESLYGVYTSTYTTKEEQEEARKKALEYGRQLVTSGQWGEEAYESMAAQFSKSTDEVINPALDTVKEKLDIVGKTVATPKVKLDTSSFDTSLSAAINRLNALDRRMGLFSKGGIVGYDTGGIIGQIPQAQYGYVLPQTGRQIPVLAEAGEIILNTSQQNNIADWLMKLSSIKPEGITSNVDSSNEVTIHIPLSFDGKVLYDIWEKYDLREGARRIQ